MRHYEDRLQQRILGNESLDISIETTTGNYTKVGTMKITDLFKKQVTDKVSKIETTNFKNKDVAVLVSQMGINSNLVSFLNDDAKKLASTKTMVASVNTSNGESNGNQLYCIVRGNNITTFCLVKSYTGFNNLAQKLRVNGIVKNLKNFK